MKTYREFQPTGFDPKGLGLEDQQDWFVLPVSRTRDSGPLAQSNFASALKCLGGESETVEVHRFGHWGPGWFEIIIVDPKDETRVKEAQEIEGCLENYPVLCDSDYSEREYACALDGWASYGAREMRRTLVKDFGLRDSTDEWLQDHEDELWDLHMKHANVPYEVDDEGASFSFGYLDRMDASVLVAWIRKVRAEKRVAA